MDYNRETGKNGQTIDEQWLHVPGKFTTGERQADCLLTM
jgi:hypothetical protein